MSEFYEHLIPHAEEIFPKEKKSNNPFREQKLFNKPNNLSNEYPLFNEPIYEEGLGMFTRHAHRGTQEQPRQLNVEGFIKTFMNTLNGTLAKTGLYAVRDQLVELGIPTHVVRSKAVSPRIQSILDLLDSLVKLLQLHTQAVRIDVLWDKKSPYVIISVGNNESKSVASIIVDMMTGPPPATADQLLASLERKGIPAYILSEVDPILVKLFTELTLLRDTLCQHKGLEVMCHWHTKTTGTDEAVMTFQGNPDMRIKSRRRRRSKARTQATSTTK